MISLTFELTHSFEGKLNGRVVEFLRFSPSPSLVVCHSNLKQVLHLLEVALQEEREVGRARGSGIDIIHHLGDEIMQLESWITTRLTRSLSIVPDDSCLMSGAGKK